MERTAPADFTEFMHARWSALFRTAYLLTGNAHDAEDLLQDALARTCVRWRSIRDKAAADAYVRRILVHDASRGWRRRTREHVTDLVPERGHDGGVPGRADGLDLWAATVALPPRMRAVLVLRYYEDLTVAETAAALGCSEGAVKSQTHAAIQRLRDAVGADLEVVLKGES